MSLGPSELILRKDQSVYHLALRPEDLAETVILVGDPARVPLVSQHFDEIELKKKNREFTTHTGRLRGKRISVLSTGIGTDNIDISLNELDALASIDFNTRKPKEKPLSLNLIRIGTCGGLQEDIPVNSFVLSDWGLGFDGLLHFYSQGNPGANGLLDAYRDHSAALDWQPKPYAYKADDSLNKVLDSEQTYRGITVTQGGFYAPQGRSLRLELREPNFRNTFRSFRFQSLRPLNMEMETAAIFGLSSLMGHKAASISVVLANRASGTFSENPREAVLALIEYTLGRITQH